MVPLPRHQCLIYEGSPSQHLPAIASVIAEKLQQNHRCLYLNSRPMVVGLRSYLAAAGVDVLEEIARGRLVLSSDQSHLVDGKFDLDRMVQMLRTAVEEARNEGYAGLWASGDMSWEFGMERDFSRLLEYEWKLEELMRENPQLSGICQYHAATMPRQCLRQGLVAHPTLFVNETLSVVNPQYLPPSANVYAMASHPEIEAGLARLLPDGDAA